MEKYCWKKWENADDQNFILFPHFFFSKIHFLVGFHGWEKLWEKEKILVVRYFHIWLKTTLHHKLQIWFRKIIFSTSRRTSWGNKPLAFFACFLHTFTTADTFRKWNRSPSYIAGLRRSFFVLAFSQTTNFRPFQTDRVCRRQF